MHDSLEPEEQTFDKCVTNDAKTVESTFWITIDAFLEMIETSDAHIATFPSHPTTEHDNNYDRPTTRRVTTKTTMFSRCARATAKNVNGDYN